MALVLADRVQQTGTANTTVSFTLTGSVTGFQSFAAIGNGNTTFYSATDTSGNWEVGLGTYSTTGPTLTRTTIYSSSNAGSAVTFSGAVTVFVTYPSGRSVNLDGSGSVSALGTVTSGTWQGSTVGVAYGGTGVTASSGANSVVLRDANQNILVNRISQGLQTITASGGTTVLTAASQFNQALVGTGGQTFQLPDATTLTDTTTFQFNNNATGTLTITNNASTTVGTIASGGAAGIALLSNATSGGTWDVHAYIPENVTWGTNALTLGSTVITGGTWNGGTISSAYGGTGLTTFTGANNALYSTSSSALAAGTLPVAAGGTGVTSSTGTGSVVLSNSPTLVTPALGAPASGNFSSGAFTWPTFNQNTTGTAASVSSTLAVTSGGTGQTTYTNGQILIGNTTGNTLTKSTLTAGSNITITNGNGSITIAATGASCATPTAAGIVYGRTSLVCAGSKTALGYNAGFISQSCNAVAIGTGAGQTAQGLSTTAVGRSAGGSNQGTSAVAIGKCAGSSNQGCTAIAIGPSAALLGQGSGAIAIGSSAGGFGQAACSIAIGKNVSAPNSGLYIAPIRNKCTAGVTCGQSVLYCTTSKELVYGAGGGGVSCATPTVAGKVYGRTEVYCACGSNRTTLGNLAGNACQGINTVAVGVKAGQTAQTGGAMAIGYLAGNCTQGAGAVAMGSGAGQTTQGSCAVAIGASAGQTSQSANAVAIGPLAGNGTQGAGAIAIGRNAGFGNQGSGAINIGSSAGFLNTPANTIVLGQLFFPSAGAGVYISSMYLGSGCGASCTNKTLYYCTSTNKVTYATASGGGLSAGKSIAYTMILGA